MQAIYNKIVIGNDQENPLFIFENDEIKSIVSDSSVSLVGEELYIDQFVSEVDYYVWQPYVFKPADGESVEYGPYSGDVVSFEADKVAPATELTIAVEPVQDLNGYDSPWPAGGGKNLLENKLSTVTNNGVTFTVNADGSMILSGTANGVAQRQINGALALKAGNYILNGMAAGGSSSTRMLYVSDGSTIIARDTGSGATFTLSADTVISVLCWVNNGQTVSNLAVYPMIRLASVTDPTYAPYSNICPISGRDAVSIWNKPTHDTSADPTVAIQIGQTVYGGTLDVTGGKMLVDRAMHTFDGTETFGGDGGANYVVPRWNEIVAGPIYTGYGVSNMLKRANSYAAIRNTPFSMSIGAGFRILLNPEGKTYATTNAAANAIAAWCTDMYNAGTPLQVCYGLATPIEITLTPTQIATLVGQNNVWSDAGTIEMAMFSLPGAEYDGFMSSDGYVLCTKRNYDIRLLPYGTKIVYYMGTFVAGTYYVKNVERVGREIYKINAVNAIGLLNRQYHRGGLYTGQTLQSVIEEILGNDYVYTIDGVVATQRVYGWLPYDTKRKNLYQLLLAYGVEIVVGDNGNMFFTFPEVDAPQPIPTNRVFGGGKVIYDEPASRVEVLEHSFHYDPTLEEVTLFDNSADAAVDHVLVKFDQPIYAESIRCSSGSLTISTTNTNYAVVSGTGVLSGRPYVHNTRLVTEDNENAPVEKVVTVEDCTVVTFINADNIVKRLGEFYFNATRVEQDLNIVNEKPGRLYTTDNAFHELITGYITRMTKTVTSIARAQCRFIQNYTPTGIGQAYTERVLIPLPDGASETWTIPQAVFDKGNPVFRVVLIGRGQDGSPGADGADGTSSGTNSGLGKGGAGGAPGAGGLGGNIMIVTLNATGLTQVTLSNSGNDSVLSSQYYHYSSADGSPNSFGYFDILTGEVLAYPGNDGVAGANGGDGDYYSHTSGEASTAQPGGDVEYEGTLYTGGSAGERAIISGSTVGISGNIRIYLSACGGGAAAPGENGGDAVGYTGPTEWGDPGNGADAVPASPPSANYGNGGNGGNGGGGGGAGNSQEYWNYAYTSVISTVSGPPGKGGKGSDGSAGNYGCAIIYY